MATKVIKFNDGINTYVPVTVASAVQYSYDGGVMSVQDAIGTIATTVVSSNNSVSNVISNLSKDVSEHKSSKDYLSYSLTEGLKLSGTHGAGNVKMVPGTGVSFAYTDGALTISSPSSHASGSDNQHLSASASGNVATISLDGDGGSVKISNNGASSAGTNTAHVAITYSTAAGIQLKVSYTDTNTHNSHALSFSAGTNTTPTANSVKVVSGFQPGAASSDTISTSYTTYSLPTQNYVDTTFVTKTDFNAFSTSGMHYKGDTATVPTSPASGDVYHVTKKITSGLGDGVNAEVGDFITYYKATGAQSGSWSVWDKNVDGALYSGNDILTSGNIVVADGTAGKVKTQSIDDLGLAKKTDITNMVTSAGSLTSNAIVLGGGNKNVNTTTAYYPQSSATAFSATSDTQIPTSKSIAKYISDQSYLKTQDHTKYGTISAGQLTYWNGTNTHAAVTASYGSATKSIYIDKGVIKEGSEFLTSQSKDFGKVTTANNATSYAAPATSAASAVADSVKDELKLTGANAWIRLGTATTAAEGSADVDNITIGHVLSPAGAKTSADVYSIKIDAAGHITEATAAVTGTVGLTSLKYKVGNDVTDIDDAALGLTFGSDLVDIATLTGDTTFVK